MAYNTDRTWVTGEVATAAYFNTYLRDNMKWLSTDKPMCRAYRSTTQSIPNVTDTAIALDSERFDNASMHSTSSLTERVLSTIAGKFLCGGHIEWAAVSTGDYRSIGLRLNASTFIANHSGPPSTFVGSSGSGSPVTLYSFGLTDYVVLNAYQNSGGAMNVNASISYSPELWMLWVGV